MNRAERAERGDRVRRAGARRRLRDVTGGAAAIALPARETRRSVPADRRALPHFSPEQYQKLQEIRRHELQRSAEKKLNQ